MFLTIFYLFSTFFTCLKNNNASKGHILTIEVRNYTLAMNFHQLKVIHGVYIRLLPHGIYFHRFCKFSLFWPYFAEMFLRKCKSEVETWLRILVEQYSSRISISRKIKSHIRGLHFVKRHFSLFFGLKFHT